MKRKTRRKILKLKLTNKELKELFEWADKLNYPLSAKLKTAIASTITASPAGSFLWHVFYYYKCDVEKVKTELERQYNEEGTKGMGLRWGFKQTTILQGLKKLEIKTKSREYNHAPHGLAREAFKRYGGIKKVLEKFGNVTRFGKVCKISYTNLAFFLKKRGYYYDKDERKWKLKKEGVNYVKQSKPNKTR